MSWRKNPWYSTPTSPSGPGTLQNQEWATNEWVASSRAAAVKTFNVVLEKAWAGMPATVCTKSMLVVIAE